jgi:hypothetical protein
MEDVKRDVSLAQVEGDALYLGRHDHDPTMSLTKAPSAAVSGLSPQSLDFAGFPATRKKTSCHKKEGGVGEGGDWGICTTTSYRTAPGGHADVREAEEAGWVFGWVGRRGLERVLSLGLEARLGRKAVWLLSWLTQCHFQHRDNPDGWTEVHRDMWRGWFGDDHRAIIAALRKDGVLQVKDSYQVGRRCKMYRVAPACHGDTVRFGLLWKPMARKIKSMRERRMLDAKANPDYASTIRALEGTTVDFNRAVRYIQRSKVEHGKKMFWLWAVRSVHERDWFTVIDPKTGRLYTNLTNMPRNLRRFMRIEGEPMVEVDVACAQPLLLSSFYKGPCEEKEKFMAWVRSDFYARLAGAAGLAHKARDWVKTETYRQVMFDRIRHYRMPLWEAFKAEFPVLGKEIGKVKRADYKQVAVVLQSAESRCVIRGACRCLGRMGIPVVSIHDGLFCRERDVPQVSASLAKAVLWETGIEPAIKVKLPQGQKSA